MERTNKEKSIRKLFNRSRLRDMVINPVYVKADYQLYGVRIGVAVVLIFAFAPLCVGLAYSVFSHKLALCCNKGKEAVFHILDFGYSRLTEEVFRTDAMQLNAAVTLVLFPLYVPDARTVNVGVALVEVVHILKGKALA